ncbi:MAG: metallophosphoesterase family protein [Burkholderiales bacterium]
MLIGVLSDTHMPRKAAKLPGAVLRAFERADTIIHAGDISDISVLRALEALAPVIAVAGNTDPPELKELLGKQKLITLDGFIVGIVHGDGKGGSTADRAARAFEHEHTDIIIFGHSHMPFLGIHLGKLLFNPGSPTDKRRNRYYSFGIIEAGKTLSPRIIYFDGNQK